LLGRIVLLALLNGLLWAAVVPPWQAPDEPKHMEFVRLMRSGEWIAFTNEERAADPDLQHAIVASMDAHRFWWYGHAPGYDPEGGERSLGRLWFMGAGSALARTSPVYHWLLARFQPPDLLAGLYVARLTSVLLGALVVLLAGLTARELFPSDPLVRYGAPLFLALHPMFAFAHAGVNNDALLNALGALAFLLMARLLVRGGSAARLLLLALVLAAAVAVKRVALALLPVGLLALVLWRATRAARPVLAAGVWAAVLAVAAGTGAWWWLRVGLERLPLQWRWNLGQYVFNDPEQLDRILAFLRAPGVTGVIVEYLWRVHEGFWGSFGWALLNFPGWLYGLLALLAVAAALGAARRALDGREAPAARAGLLLGGLALGAVAAAAVAFFLGYLDQPYPVPPQGRYLFAAAAPAALLLAAGWGAWLPPARRRPALVALGLAMAALNVAALVGVTAWFYA